MKDTFTEMAGILRIRIRDNDPLSLAEMLTLAEALENYGTSVTASLTGAMAILQPKRSEIPPLPPFSIIRGGRT